MAHEIALIKAGSSDLLLNNTATSWDYRLESDSWSPGIAETNPSAGGRPYRTVRESFAVRINGTSAAQVLDRLDALKRRLNEAALYGRGLSSTPVYLRVKINGGTYTWNSLVLGPSGDGPMITMPASFLTALDGNQIGNVGIVFERLGEWSRGVGSAPPSSTAPTGDIMYLTALTDTNKAMLPCSIQINQQPDSGGGYSPWNGTTLLLWATDTSGSSIVKANADGLNAASSGGVVSNPTDTGNYPSSASGKVCRWTPTVPNTPSVLTGIMTGLYGAALTGRRFAAYMTVRQNGSLATVYTLTFGLSQTGGEATSTVVVPNTSNNVQVLALGVLSLPELGSVWGVFGSIVLEATAASGSLDIDAIYLLDLDRPDSCILEIGNGQRDVWVTNRELDDRDALVYSGSPSGSKTTATYVFGSPNLRAALPLVRICAIRPSGTKWNANNLIAGGRVQAKTIVTPYQTALIPY